MNSWEYETGKLIEFTNISIGEIEREEQWNCFHDFQTYYMLDDEYCSKCDINESDYKKYGLELNYG